MKQALTFGHDYSIHFYNQIKNQVEKDGSKKINKKNSPLKIGVHLARWVQTHSEHEKQNQGHS